MENIEIKREFDIDEHSLWCRTCLCIGRRLILLGKYCDIYRKITTEIAHFSSLDQLQVCWECYAVLRKAAQFQNKVKRANEILQGQSYINTTLSSLSMIILNDKHPSTIYVTENSTNIPTDITECDTHTETYDEKDFIQEDYVAIEETSKPAEEIARDIKTEIVQSEKPKIQSKYANRWTKERAYQNKKPKFKILTSKDINKIFRVVQIDSSELQEYLQNERDSEYYKSKRYRCETCVLGFKTEKALLKHGTKHNKQLPYSCDVCACFFHDKRHLVSHVEKHYQKYECTVCNYTCYSEKQKLKHVAGEHTKIFQCVKCGLKFGDRDEFGTHFKNWHEKFTCDHCGISFKMRYCIEKHIRKQHSPLECKPCNKRFSRYNGLWLHKKTCHAARSVAAYCVECDRQYVDEYRYKWHLANSARHRPTKKKRIPCPSCEKVFTKNIYMKNHYNLVHLKKYNHRCENCDKNYLSNADLVKHRRRVHEGFLAPKNKICYMCGRGFTTNRVLANHIRTHTGERPHACALCPARFTQRAALTVHTRAEHRNTT